VYQEHEDDFTQSLGGEINNNRYTLNHGIMSLYRQHTYIIGSIDFMCSFLGRTRDDALTTNIQNNAKPQRLQMCIEKTLLKLVIRIEQGHVYLDCNFLYKVISTTTSS
jgi:hypothetical protein